MNVFDLNEKKIIEKIESLKFELDKIKDDLIKINRAYEKEFINSFKDGLQFEIDYNYFITQMSKSLQSSNVREEILRKNMFKCQNYIIELKNFYYDKADNILFKPSDKVINLEIVGTIQGSKIAAILTHHLRSLDLGLQSCNGMCLSNGWYASY